MSEKLQQTIIKRIRESETEAIDIEARDEAAETAQFEKRATYEALISERTRVFGAKIIECFEKQVSRGKLMRFLNRNDPKIESFHYSTVHELKFPSIRQRHGFRSLLPTPEGEPIRVRNGKISVGIRTPSFGIETNHVEDLTFNTGWQVGFITEVIRTGGPGGPQPLEQGKYDGPVMIYKSVHEIHSRETEQELVYQVDPNLGNVISYTEGKPDDRLVTIGREAGAHALVLINQAIDLLED